MVKQIVAIGGGKGGVGKSLVASNLAIAMAQSGKRVVLVDADLGGANLHTLFGIDSPKHLLEDFLHGKIPTLEMAMVKTPQSNLHLISGGMPLPGSANPKYSQKQKLLRRIKKLDADVVMLDIGSGVSFNVLDLYNAAEFRLLVLAPQLTSLHNGYGFLKAALHRSLMLQIKREMRPYVESAGPAHGAESLLQMINRLKQADLAEGERAHEHITSQKVYLVGNQLQSNKEIQVLLAVSKMIRDHLAIQAPLLGGLFWDDKILRSVNERTPYLLHAASEQSAIIIKKIADYLLLSAKKRYERRWPRFMTDHSVLFRSEGKSFQGDMCNLAYGGVLVRFADSIHERPAMGSLLINGYGPISIQVRERHRGASGHHLGFEFNDLSAPARQLISDLVSQAQANLIMH